MRLFELKHLHTLHLPRYLPSTVYGRIIGYLGTSKHAWPSPGSRPGQTPAVQYVRGRPPKEAVLSKEKSEQAHPFPFFIPLFFFFFPQST